MHDGVRVELEKTLNWFRLVIFDLVVVNVSLAMIENIRLQRPVVGQTSSLASQVLTTGLELPEHEVHRQEGRTHDQQRQCANGLRTTVIYN